MINIENPRKKLIIEGLIETQEWDALFMVVRKMPVIDIVDVLYELDDDVALYVLGRFSVQEQGDIVSEFDRERQMKLFNLLDRPSFVEIFRHMASDVRVDLYQDMSRDQQHELLSALDEETSRDVRHLNRYDPDTAGGIMSTGYVSLRAEMSVDQALRKIRNLARTAETVYLLYVIDSGRRLVGELSLAELVSARKMTKVGEIMNEDFARVTTDADQEEVARLLKERDLLAVPVVDGGDRLVGIVTVDDAMDVLEEEVTDDMFDKIGITDIAHRETGRSELLIRGTSWDVLKVRVPFLIVTLAGGMLAGVVIDSFEQTLEAIAAVAIFIPVIMDMGGNIGTQSSTIFTRAFVLGHIDISDFGKPFLKEVKIGLTIGAIMGVAAGIIAAVWQQSVPFGWAVGISLFLTMTLATSLGFFVPWLLVKMGFDQAAGSDPFITTIKDVTGLVIYFSSVHLFLSHML